MINRADAFSRLPTDRWILLTQLFFLSSVSKDVTGPAKHAGGHPAGSAAAGAGQPDKRQGVLAGKVGAERHGGDGVTGAGFEAVDGGGAESEQVVAGAG